MLAFVYREQPGIAARVFVNVVEDFGENLVDHREIDPLPTLRSREHRAVSLLDRRAVGLDGEEGHDVVRVCGGVSGAALEPHPVQSEGLGETEVAELPGD